MLNMTCIHKKDFKASTEDLNYFVYIFNTNDMIQIYIPRHMLVLSVPPHIELLIITHELVRFIYKKVLFLMILSCENYDLFQVMPILQMYFAV